MIQATGACKPRRIREVSSACGSLHNLSASHIAVYAPARSFGLKVAAASKGEHIPLQSVRPLVSAQEWLGSFRRMPPDSYAPPCRSFTAALHEPKTWRTLTRQYTIDAKLSRVALIIHAVPDFTTDYDVEPLVKLELTDTASSGSLLGIRF